MGILNSRLVRDAALGIGGGFAIAIVTLLLALLPEKREALEAVLEAEAAGTAKLFASLTPPTPNFSDMAAALLEPFVAETRIRGVLTTDGAGTRWLALGPSPPDLAPLLGDIPPGGVLRAYSPDKKAMDFAWALTFNNDPGRHYVLTARVDAAYVYDELTEFAVTSGMVAFIAAVMLTAGMVSFLNLRIIRPVLRLSVRMQAASNDPDHPERYRDPANEPGEIGDMARSFNAMVGRIGETLEARQQAEAAAAGARDRAETALAELRRAQENLIESEKMAALGGLVAGVAHEINTPIGNALGAVSHLHGKSQDAAELFYAGKLRKQDADDFIKTTLEAGDIALSNIQRAAALVHSFKQVAADHTADMRRPFGLGEYMAEVLTSLTPQIRRARIEVETDIPADIEMESYPGALAQIVANIVANAALHAFGDDDGLATDGAARPRHMRIAARRLDGGMLRLRIADNGRGMAEAVRARVFEPFFTTRRGAGGTGLGMHIVYNLVTQRLGGRIKLASVAGYDIEGHGTTYTMTLPLTAPVAAARQEGAGA